MWMMPLESKKMVAMIFPADGTDVAFFGDSLNKVYCFNCCLVSDVIVNPCFVTVTYQWKNSRGLRLNQFKYSLEMVIRTRLFSTEKVNAAWWRQLSHAQYFMQDMKYPFFWDAYHLYYLTQFQMAVTHNNIEFYWSFLR